MTTPPRIIRGFTLVELMIVVAIVAILAAIGYPSYAEHVAKGRRADAKSLLLENAQWMERQFTLSNAYNKLGDGSTLSSTSLPVKEAPRDGTTKFYDITFASGFPTATAFTLQAEPKGGMSSDKCGTFTLTHTGAPDVSGATFTKDQCWSK